MAGEFERVVRDFVNDPQSGQSVPAAWFYVVLGRVLEAALKAGSLDEADRVLESARRVLTGGRPNG